MILLLKDFVLLNNSLQIIGNLEVSLYVHEYQILKLGLHALSQWIAVGLPILSVFNPKYSSVSRVPFLIIEWI